jgi:hypothetical protein
MKQQPRRPESARESTRPSGSGCADVITAIFLILTVSVIAITVLLIANPQSPLNPLPPSPLPTIIVLATAAPTNTPTKTDTPLPASPTPIATITPSFTATVPTNTPTSSYTPVIAVRATVGSPAAGRTPSPAYTQSTFPFTVNTIRYVANTTKDGCSWQSIIVLALDLNKQPIKGLLAHIVSPPNMDEWDPLNQHSQLGDNTLEVVLGSVPREDQYTVTLVNHTGNAISDVINVQTHTACDQNVAVVTFMQNHAYN